MDSVLRPLATALTDRSASEPTPAASSTTIDPAQPVEASVGTLAPGGDRAAGAHGAGPAPLTACWPRRQRACSDLALELSPAGGPTGPRLAGHAARAPGRAARGDPVAGRNGPYLVTNARGCPTNWLGETLPSATAAGAVPLRGLVDQAALRRHATPDGFTRRQGPQPGSRPARHLRRPAGDDPRQPRHLPALRAVHRPARRPCSAPPSEPFVAPSGGRMDEIIRAVRDCPSGALSYAIDGDRGRASRPTGTARASRRSR